MKEQMEINSIVSKEAEEKSQEINEGIIDKNEGGKFKPEFAKQINESLINIYFKDDVGEKAIISVRLNAVKGGIGIDKFYTETVYPGRKLEINESVRSLEEIKQKIKDKYGVEVE